MNYRSICNIFEVLTNFKFLMGCLRCKDSKKNQTLSTCLLSIWIMKNLWVQVEFFAKFFHLKANSQFQCEFVDHLLPCIHLAPSPLLLSSPPPHPISAPHSIHHHYVLRYHLAYAWLRRELHRVTVRLSRIPQSLACQHLGRAEPDCINRLERKSQGMTPFGLQDKRLKGHTKEWLPCIEQQWWWFKKTKLESLGLHTRVYIQVTRALKLLPKVHKP